VTVEFIDTNRDEFGVELHRASSRSTVGNASTCSLGQRVVVAVADRADRGDGVDLGDCASRGP
jgi:hypothetical protein